MSVQFARSQAEQLLESLEFRQVPVDVKKIARKLKLELVHKDLGTEVSALLISGGRSAAVYVNSEHHVNRQRFSIAHEIGHFVLRHQFEAGEHVHVDQGNFISARGPRASTGIDPKEIEANQFAAALLMPSKLLRKEAHSIRGNERVLLDVHVHDLATKFAVSEQAMTIRLSTLGLL